MKSKSHSAYITEYIKTNLDEIKIRLPKGQKEIWQHYAQKRGESLNSYICRSINKSIRDDELKSYPIFSHKKGGAKMNIDFRDSQNKLYSKDILDITLDMEVSKTQNGKYVVNINKNYKFDQEYNTQEEAEAQLKHLTYCKNELENELRKETY